jgi:cold shock CspA family protein
MMAHMSAQMMSMMSSQMFAQMPSQMKDMISTMGARTAKEQFVGTHTPTHEQYMREDEHGGSSIQSLSSPGDAYGDGHRFTGRIKRSYEMSSGGGYGFIESNEAKVKFGRDVYIHAKQMVGYQIGDSVSFTITKNSKGEPQARNVMRTEDAVILRAQQHQSQQMQELRHLQKHKGASIPMASAGGGMMTEEEAKKFQASLKKNRL